MKPEQCADCPARLEQELWELTVKAGRRCAYDLKHATDDMQDPEFRAILRSRADHFLRIFNSAGGPKDYRTRLGMDLAEAERNVERLRAQLIGHGIDPVVDELPF